MSDSEEPLRECAECHERIHLVEGIWRHVYSNRVCKDGWPSKSG